MLNYRNFLLLLLYMSLSNSGGIRFTSQISDNDILFRGQVAIGGTAIQSGYSLTMTGAIDMNNSSIDYVHQLHFNDNVRFYEEGNNQYLNFKSDKIRSENGSFRYMEILYDFSMILSKEYEKIIDYESMLEGEQITLTSLSRLKWEIDLLWFFIIEMLQTKGLNYKQDETQVPTKKNSHLTEPNLSYYSKS